jgi:hypothetical protein
MLEDLLEPRGVVSSPFEVVVERHAELAGVGGACDLRQRLDELALRAVEVGELFREDVFECLQLHLLLSSCPPRLPAASGAETEGVFRRRLPGTRQLSFQRRCDVPGKKAHMKNKEQYEKLKEKGMSKERAARIANSPSASSRGGKASHSGSSRSSSSQGGMTAQKKAAGRKGGKATARKQGS